MSAFVTDRRGFFRLAGAAGAGVGMLGTAAARAALLESEGAPVWAFHQDYLYLDRSAGAEAYRPPLGARGAEPLASLDADELARMHYRL